MSVCFFSLVLYNNTSVNNSPAINFDAPRPPLKIKVGTALPVYCDDCEGDPVEGETGDVSFGATPVVHPVFGTPGTALVAVVGVVAVY